MPVNQGTGAYVLEPYLSLTVPCYPNSSCMSNEGWYSQVLQYQNGTKARSEVRDPTEVSRSTAWRPALYRGYDGKPEPLGSPDSGDAERPSRAGTAAGGRFVGGGSA